MRENWLRNSNGNWINLDRIEFVQVNERRTKAHDTYYEIIAFESKDQQYEFFEEKTFDSEEMAKIHLDNLMRGFNQ